MSGTVSVPNTFGAGTSGTTPQLDANFTSLVNAFNNPLTYAIYSTDSGAVNAYVATLAPAPSSQASLLGVAICFKVTTGNTGASTLNVNALGVQAIVNRNGSALTSGQMPAGTSIVVWDGTNYVLQTFGITSITNSLGADVLLNNTASYFDGPSVAQGTVGTWYVSGTVVLSDGTAGTNTIHTKLWDGTTVIASAYMQLIGASLNTMSITLSGFIASPAGNLKISAKDVTTTAGKINFNATGNSKDSTITAIRIA